jgi:hypothetical protein
MTTVSFEEACRLQREWLTSLSPKERLDVDIAMFVRQCERRLVKDNVTYLIPSSGPDSDAFYKALRDKYYCTVVMIKDPESDACLTFR